MSNYTPPVDFINSSYYESSLYKSTKQDNSKQNLGGLQKRNKSNNDFDVDDFMISLNDSSSTD